MNLKLIWKINNGSKILNNMNLEYMKEIFYKIAFFTHRPLYLKVNENHTIKFENKTLRCLGPHIWNSLPNQFKKETVYTKFKVFINDWLSMKCKCNLCSFLTKVQKFQSYITNTASNLTRF